MPKDGLNCDKLLVNLAPRHDLTGKLCLPGIKLFCRGATVKLVGYWRGELAVAIIISSFVFILRKT